MPTDRQIALMCDIGQSPDLDAEDAGDLAALVDAGFVEPDREGAASGLSDAARYRLTKKGERFLAERGAGLNEA